MAAPRWCGPDDNLGHFEQFASFISGNNVQLFAQAHAAIHCNNVLQHASASSHSRTCRNTQTRTRECSRSRSYATSPESAPSRPPKPTRPSRRSLTWWLRLNHQKVECQWSAGQGNVFVHLFEPCPCCLGPKYGTTAFQLIRRIWLGCRQRSGNGPGEYIVFTTACMTLPPPDKPKQLEHEQARVRFVSVFVFSLGSVVAQPAHADRKLPQS